jgi:hypothetical protein
MIYLLFCVDNSKVLGDIVNMKGNIMNKPKNTEGRSEIARLIRLYRNNSYKVVKSGNTQDGFRYLTENFYTNAPKKAFSKLELLAHIHDYKGLYSCFKKQ